MPTPIAGRTGGAMLTPAGGRPNSSTPVLRMAVLGLAAAVFSGLFVLSFGYAQHSPRPHGIRIDVAGSAGVVNATRHALSQVVPDGFDVRQVATEAQARQDLRHLASSGALVLATDGTARILTAGAAGTPLQQVVDKALSGVATAQGKVAQLDDVVPVRSGDRAGLSAFALELGLLVPSVIGAIGLYLAGRRTRVLARVVGAIVYCVIAGAFSVAVSDVLFGALTGSPWVLFGDAVLIAGTFVMSVAALHCLMGLAGTGFAAAALIVVGNAVNGVAVPTSMLPDVYRQLAPWMPNNAAVRLIRSDMYFHGHGQSGALVTLGIWLGAAFVILTVTEVVHLRLLRHERPVPPAQVYSMSLIGHLRARGVVVRTQFGRRCE